MRLGLESSPPAPDAWVSVASAPVEDAETGASTGAADIVRALDHAGIETQQRPYVVPDRGSPWGASSPSADERIRVSVLVRQRDLTRARAQLGEFAVEPDA